MAYNELKKYLPDQLLDHIVMKYLMPSVEEMKKKHDSLIKQYKSAILGPVYFLSGDPEEDDNELSRFTRLGLLKKIMNNSQLKLDIIDSLEESDNSNDISDSDTASELEVARAVVGMRHRTCCHRNPEDSDIIQYG